MARYYPPDYDDRLDGEAFECTPDSGDDYTPEYWDDEDAIWSEDVEGYPCPECGSVQTQVEGAASDGDGDLYNQCVCYDCGATFAEPGSTVWIANDGSQWDSEELMWQRDAELADEGNSNG